MWNSSFNMKCGNYEDISKFVKSINGQSTLTDNLSKIDMKNVQLD